MNILDVINNYEKFSNEYIKKQFGQKMMEALDRNYTNDERINNWKKILEKYPNFVPMFDEILDNVIVDNFDVETLYRNNDAESCIRYINEENKDEMLPKINKVLQYKENDESARRFLYSYNETNKEHYDIIFNDKIIDNLEVFKGYIYAYLDPSVKFEELKDRINTFSDEDIELLKELWMQKLDPSKDNQEFILDNKERLEKIGYGKVFELLKETWKCWILNKDVISDEDIDLLGIDKLEHIEKEKFLEIKKQSKLEELKNRLYDEKFEKADVESVTDFVIDFENITKILPEKFINGENLNFILENNDEEKLKVLKKLFEKNSNFTGSLDTEVFEKIGLDNYLFLFNRNPSENDSYRYKMSKVKKCIEEGKADELKNELEILRNDVGLKYVPYRYSNFFDEFYATKAKGKGYLQDLIKLKELSEDSDAFYIDNVDILNPEISKKIGLENILKLDTNRKRYLVELYEKGYFNQLDKDELMQLSGKYWGKQENIDILNKLLETNKVKTIGKNLEDFFDVVDSYNTDYINELIDSDLFEKYDVEKIIEGLHLKPSAKLMDANIETLSLEQLEVFATIKHEFPDFDFSEHDKYFQALNKEYLERYGVEDLKFICEKIKITSHTTYSGKIDDTCKFNITDIQLQKLKSIIENNPDFVLTVLDKLFNKEEFWELENDIILNKNKVYQADDKLLKIIEDGKLPKWLERLNKQELDNKFIPKDPILLDDRILSVFTDEEITEFSDDTIRILRQAEDLGTLDNLLVVLNNNDKKFPSLNDIAYITDKNIELFGMENIIGNGHLYGKISKDEVAKKNYKIIKEKYGDFVPYSVEILSDENVEKLGYENIFKFFNTKGMTYEERIFLSQKIGCIPEQYTKEQIDKIIELYGDFPQIKEWYNEKIIEVVQKNNIKFPIENKYKDIIVARAIEYGREEDLAYLLTVDFDKLIYTEYTGSKYYTPEILKVIDKEIEEELGFENLTKICKYNMISEIGRVRENGKLKNWRILLDNIDAKNIINLKSIYLLDDQVMQDLTYEEIGYINQRAFSEISKDFLDNIKEKPEYIELFALPYENRQLNKMDETEREKEFEIFSQIRNVFGKEKFGRLISEYDLMKKAYLEGNGRLENWSKILDEKEYFVPASTTLLDENILENCSLDEISKIISDDKILLSNLDKIPRNVFKVLDIKTLRNFYDKNKDSSEDFTKLDAFLENEISPNLTRYIKEMTDNYEPEIFDLLERAEKFDTVSHFIPAISVLKKYPEEQIEKFNKKIWFNLARNELYNTTEDTKNALVEAILSMGAFEIDEYQQERIGMLSKFATYIPKTEVTVEDENGLIAKYFQEPDKDKLLKDSDILQLFGTEKEVKEEIAKCELIAKHFEVLEEKVTDVKYTLNRNKLLSDPNILRLFKTKEDAENEINKLNEWYSEDYMENVLKKEYVTEKYKQIMTYIYKTGYDKEEKKEYKVKLKTDIQQLKAKDKKEGNKLENEIRKFYYSTNPSDMMTPDKLHRIFDGMDMKYKPGFYEFFENNLEAILEDTEKQGEISKIQRQWDKIVEANLGQKINFEKCENYIFNQKYDNIEADEKEIAKLSSNCGYSQEDFNEIKKIYHEQMKRQKSSIPEISETNSKSGYTYKVLRLDDPIAIFVGELTDCCQALGDDGDSCMRHSVTSENGRVLVVQDEQGKILSQSWIWRNKNVLCFDNIEAIKKDSDNRKVVSKEILGTVKRAAKEFVEKDETFFEGYEREKIERLEKEKSEGKISLDEFNAEKEKIQSFRKGQQLTKVTVGIGYTDVNLSGLKYDNENRYPEESVEYINDSRTQLILYEDKSIEHENTKQKTVAMYYDEQNSKKLIDVDTSEIEHDDEYDDDEYYDDEYDDEEYDDNEYEDDEYYEDEEYYDEDEEYYDEDAEFNLRMLKEAKNYDNPTSQQIRNSKIHFDKEIYENDVEDDLNEPLKSKHNRNFMKIGLEDIRKTINYRQNRTEAQEALSNIRKYLETVPKDERNEGKE